MRGPDFTARLRSCRPRFDAHNQANDHQAAFLQALAALVGEECWGVTGGEGSGSVISLDIGARTLRRRPIPNPHLSELVRHYDSAYSLLIRRQWRIDTATEIVSGRMSNANVGPMVRGLAAIRGQVITSVNCAGPADDLRIGFDNGHALVIHCSASGSPEDRSYSCGTPAGHYTVHLDDGLGFAPARTRPASEFDTEFDDLSV